MTVKFCIIKSRKHTHPEYFASKIDSILLFWRHWLKFNFKLNWSLMNKRG